MTGSLTPAERGDRDALLPLVGAYHAFEHINSSDQHRAAALDTLLANPALGGVWFVTHDQARCGYIALCTGYSLEFGGRDAFIDEFFLLPQWRGPGGGKAALELIKSEARRLDLRALHLGVGRENLAARRLYARAGLEAREAYTLMSITL